MGEKGWIKLHRRIQDCWIWDEKPFDKPRAWIDLLLLANHADKKIMFNGNPLIIKRGQYLTSIRKLAERWGWSYDKVSRFLNALVLEDMLRKESDNSRTLLTVINYEVYQDVPNADECTERTPTSEPTEHQQVSTPNADRTPTSDKQECKELKELKNNKVDAPKSGAKRFTPPSVDEVKQYCSERGNNVDAQAFVDFYQSKGWVVGKEKMKDWKAAVRTWERRERKDNAGRTSENNRQNKIYTDEWCDHIYD